MVAAALDVADLDNTAAQGAEGCGDDFTRVGAGFGFPAAVLGADEERPGGGFGRIRVTGKELGAGVDGQEVWQEDKLDRRRGCV